MKSYGLVMAGPARAPNLLDGLGQCNPSLWNGFKTSYPLSTKTKFYNFDNGSDWSTYSKHYWTSCSSSGTYVSTLCGSFCGSKWGSTWALWSMSDIQYIESRIAWSDSSEYPAHCDERRAFISGFNGSAGLNDSCLINASLVHSKIPRMCYRYNKGRVSFHRRTVLSTGWATIGSVCYNSILGFLILLICNRIGTGRWWSKAFQVQKWSKSILVILVDSKN